ncbi:RsmB/NOP family class I SAM-dependent RNA methyltransferase [Vitreimonas flagellata]|uniref:RsmB/NOP family class I SAM-dependent RNA methyltransferase n=1 Tax=Vitreimonas flagellata TaxID=2560861 RepID=UPI001EF84247|nr:transcription antitermination factor NusB [Vitreimonas flagellata]
MSARRAATDLLVAVMDRGRALEDAMAETPSFNALEGRDRAFARALVTAGLRRLGSVDTVLSEFLQRPLPDSAEHARALLHLGATQLLVLGTPAHAAVGETVETANHMREARGFAKLMNAVLRKVAGNGAEILASLPPGADLPAWLYTRWRATYGEAAPRIAQVLAREAPLDISVREDAAGWAGKLGGVLTPTGTVRLTDPAPIDTLPGFDEGAWWVQDAAAALPAKLLGDVRGKRVLDLCAAPGGKTLQLAAAGAHVTAVDKSEARLKRLRENLARTKLKAEVICADALEFRAEPFDAVLLDAPCTSTGTLRRHPDVAWLRRPTDVRALAELQAKLVAASAKLLKPGAPLLYAVCSLEPEEGPGIVAEALRNGWRRNALTSEIPAEFITADGDMRTHPGFWPELGGLDGFYAARLLRT